MIDDGVTGFIVDDVDGAVEAVGRIDQLSRATCRSTFEARFSVERMARDYVALYEHLVLEGAQDAIGPIHGTVAVGAG